VFKVAGSNDGQLNKKMNFKVEANSETLYPTIKNALDFTAVTPSNVLLLDLAGTATARFNQVFTQLQEPACFLNAVESADLDSAGLTAANIGKLFYSTGAAYSGTLGEYRSEAFTKYLNSGGNMLIIGQDIGYEIGTGGDAASLAFFSDYMGAEYISDGPTTTISLTRNLDDTLIAPFFPTNLTLSGTGSYPEHLAVSGSAPNAVGFLDYSDSDIGGIYNSGDNWKMVYLGFRMEAFATTTAGNNLRNTLFGRINGWFESNPSLSASISGPSVLCQGSNITLTSNPAASYLWNTGATTQTITVTAAGNYLVQTTEQNGTAVSSIQTVTASANPVISSQPANQTAPYGSSATFTVASSSPGAVFQWQKDPGTGFADLSNDAQYSGTNTNTLTVSGLSAADNGHVFRCVVSLNGCPKTSTAAALTTTSTSAIAGKIEIGKAAYPNPAKNQLMVPVSAQVKTLIISDLSGREVLRQSVQNAGADQVLQIETLGSGVYQLTMEAPGYAPAIQKVVIR
jgi:hypothetical protein